MGFLDIRAEIGDLDGGFARASDSVVMILTCPECATGYFVDDAQMRPGGRAVRCAACGARWTAYPEGPLELVSSPEEGALAKPPGEEDAELAPLTGDDLPKAFRSRAEDEKRMRRAAVSGAVWAGAALLLAAVIGAAVVFRDDVVRIWPRSASAYAAIGLTVNPIGLVILDVRAQPSLEAGHATLDVSGVIRSVSDRTVTAPPLRISLFNAQGKRVAGQIAILANAQIPPGQVRRFSTAIVDPPFSAQDGSLQVEFAPDAKGAPAPVAPPAPPVPAIDLRGPATADQPASASAANAVDAGNTVEAQPLGSDQPAALPAGGARNAHD